MGNTDGWKVDGLSMKRDDLVVLCLGFELAVYFRFA